MSVLVNTPKSKIKGEKTMYAIKLTNMFQDPYNELHKDGLLSEYDCDSDRDSDRHNIQTFGEIKEAQEVAETLYFHGAPDLKVVEL